MGVYPKTKIRIKRTLDSRNHISLSQPQHARETFFPSCWERCRTGNIVFRQKMRKTWARHMSVQRPIYPQPSLQARGSVTPAGLDTHGSPLFIQNLIARNSSICPKRRDCFFCRLQRLLRTMKRQTTSEPTNLNTRHLCMCL